MSTQKIMKTNETLEVIEASKTEELKGGFQSLEDNNIPKDPGPDPEDKGFNINIFSCK